MAFIGRKVELETLARLWRKSSPSFVVCSGRRRIGKSTLIEEFAARSGCRFIEIEGLAPDKRMTDGRQRDHFLERLADIAGVPPIKAESWPKAFDALLQIVKSVPGKTVVFLDEISWMGGYEPGFAAFLKNAWDTGFSKCDGLVFVVCGSVSAWISENILKSKGFVGRVSLDIRVGELPLSDCAAFWGQRISRVSTSDVLDLLSVTGGVPKYLQEIDPALGAADNIRELCFLPGGYLFKDFDILFTDVFSRTADEKRAVLEYLVDAPRSIEEIAAATGAIRNGHLSELLSQLREAGFVSCDEGLNPATGKPLRSVRYRICDNYVRFYLKCVAPRAAAIRKGLFKLSSLEMLPGWNSILGLQFEALVANHLQEFMPKLGVGNALVTSVAPFARAATKSRPGVQIDLLVQTRKSVCVVEIKRRDRIDESVEEEVQRKVELLSLPRGVSVRTALVYEGSLSPAIVENGYFDFLVPVSSVIGLQRAHRDSDRTT